MNKYQKLHSYSYYIYTQYLRVIFIFIYVQHLLNEQDKHTKLHQQYLVNVILKQRRLEQLLLAQVHFFWCHNSVKSQQSKYIALQFTVNIKTVGEIICSAVISLKHETKCGSKSIRGLVSCLLEFKSLHGNSRITVVDCKSQVFYLECESSVDITQIYNLP